MRRSVKTMATSELADPYIVNYVYNSAYGSHELHLALAFWEQEC